MSGPSAILGLLRTHGLIEHGFKILHGVEIPERGVEIPARGVVPTQILSKSVRMSRKKMKTSAKEARVQTLSTHRKTHALDVPMVVTIIKQRV